jgi:anti-anti-sigma factor
LAGDGDAGRVVGLGLELDERRTARAELGMIGDSPAAGDLTTGELGIWIDLTGNSPCVGVAGDLDVLTCHTFRDALEQARAVNPRHIALDFTEVTFIGSNAIREIVRLMPSTDRIEIRSPTRAVQSVLDMVQLDGRVVIVDRHRR